MSASIFNDGQPLDWGKPDSFVTAIMGALSMSFPVGEDFFIESIKRSHASLPDDLKQKWKSEVDRFYKEEENHSRAHVMHNERNCAEFGFVNNWSVWAAKRLAKMDNRDVRHYSACVAATEHLTTILGAWLLLNKHILENAPKETRSLWLWHAAEELGHREIAIDMYRDLGGSEKWRIKWMRIIYTVTIIDCFRQTVHNIWRMGGFFKLSTWVNGYKLMFSKNGVMRWSYPYFKAYGRENYHISQDLAMIDMALAQR
jgi:predicted metal-dependent hydrolase